MALELGNESISLLYWRESLSTLQLGSICSFLLSLWNSCDTALHLIPLWLSFWDGLREKQCECVKANIFYSNQLFSFFRPYSDFPIRLLKPLKKNSCSILHVSFNPNNWLHSTTLMHRILYAFVRPPDETLKIRSNESLLLLLWHHILSASPWRNIISRVRVSSSFLPAWNCLILNLLSWHNNFNS